MNWNGALRGTLAAAVSLAFAICPIAARANSILAVSDVSTGNVDFFDGTTGALLNATPMPSVGGSPGSPRNLTFGPDGLLYVADQTNSVVAVFNPVTGDFVGNFVSTGSGIGALQSPSGLAFGSDGNLYVGNWGAGGNSYINVYGGPASGSPGSFLSQFVAPGFGPVPGGLFDPGGMVFHNGDLFVADSSNGGIAQFNGTTGAFTQFVPPGNPPSPLANPQDVVFDAAGNLYVTDVTNSVVYEYGPTGTFLGAFVPDAGGLVQPIGMAFGPDGNLYVADGLGRIAAFNGTTGDTLPDLVPVAGGLINPQYLAFSPAAAPSTPEPSTFVLITLGVAGFLWSRRFRLRA